MGFPCPWDAPAPLSPGGVTWCPSVLPDGRMVSLPRPEIRGPQQRAASPARPQPARAPLLQGMNRGGTPKGWAREECELTGSSPLLFPPSRDRTPRVCRAPSAAEDGMVAGDSRAAARRGAKPRATRGRRGAGGASRAQEQGERANPPRPWRRRGRGSGGTSRLPWEPPQRPGTGFLPVASLADSTCRAGFIFPSFE